MNLFKRRKQKRLILLFTALGEYRIRPIMESQAGLVTYEIDDQKRIVLNMDGTVVQCPYLHWLPHSGWDPLVAQSICKARGLP